MSSRRAPRPSPRRDARGGPKGESSTLGRPLRQRAWIVRGLGIGVALAIAAGLAGWKAFRVSGNATAQALLAEAKANLALDRSADAARAFERACEVEPTLLEAWRGRLERLRVLDRPLEALKLGLVADAAVEPSSRGAILALTTLAALAEPPDDEARDRLNRWIAADPNDLDARVALLARIAADPHPGDPDRATRIAELTEILSRDPAHVPAREALVVALGDAGEPDRGRQVLEEWPEDARDARYDRLRGRWELDYDHNPERAADLFARALVDLPYDWKSHYGLARAYRTLGRDVEARSEARAVARVRERLDPATLGPRLAGDLGKLGDPGALNDVAALCEGVGLVHLAESWRREALGRTQEPGPSSTDR